MLITSDRFRGRLRQGLALCVLAAPLAPLAAADAWEQDFQGRAQVLMTRLATQNWQPSPNFSDAHKHYWVTGLSLIETTPEGVNHPRLNDGAGADTTRPPLWWGIIKYDREAASGTVSDAARGTASGNNISFSNNPGVFHFILPGLAALAGLYPDIPAWDDPFHGNPALTYRQNYLRFVLQRSDNYNAFTGEGTENHINMSRPSAWVLASEAVRIGYEAPGTTFTAAQRRDQMRAWMLAWSQRMFTVGMGEWDSGTYHAISLEGWLVAYAYAGTERGWDPEVRAAARAVLDVYASILAVKQTGFMMGGAESRSGRNFSRMDNGTAYLAWLWYGQGSGAPPGSWRDNQAGEAVYAAISDYRPPVRVIELAQRVPTVGETYHNTKPRYLLQAAAESVEVFHAAPTYTLGSANVAIGGFHASTFQVVNWKLLTRPAAGAFPDVVSGNGGFYTLNGANYRDPWTQFAQHENVLVQLTRVPADAAAIVAAVQSAYGQWQASWYSDFTARWSSPDWGGFNGSMYNGRTIPLNFQASSGNVGNARTSYLVYPSSATPSISGDVRFLQIGQTYLAVRSVRGTAPGLNSGNRTFTDIAPAADQLAGLIIEVGNAVEHGTFTAFRDAVIATTALDVSKRDSENRVTYTNLAGDLIDVTYQVSGSWVEPDFDWDYGVRTPGGVALMHTADWRQPEWPSGDGHGRVPAMTVNGSPVVSDETQLIDGPGLSLGAGVLQVKDGATVLYRLDYTGAAPQFELLLPATAVTVDGGDLTVTAATERGLRYRLEASTDLRSWTALTELAVGTGEPLTVTRPAAAGPEFFRVVVMP